MTGRRKIDEEECTALRECALLCWQHRAALQLPAKTVDQVLVAWMAVGTAKEGEAASVLLAARRETETKQATFDGLLGG